MIGDAWLLSLTSSRGCCKLENLHNLIKHFHRIFCGKKIETAWQHFQKNKKLRIDLDPKVPYLVADDDGNLIEPTDEQMKEPTAGLEIPIAKRTLESKDL